MMNRKRYDRPLLMTAADVRRVLDVSTTTLYRWTAEHEIMQVKGRGVTGRQVTYYSSAAVVAIARRSPRPGAYKISTDWQTQAVKAAARTAYQSMRGLYNLPMWRDDDGATIDDKTRQALDVIGATRLDVPAHLVSLVERVCDEPSRYGAAVARSVVAWWKFARRDMPKRPARALVVSGDGAPSDAMVEHAKHVRVIDDRLARFHEVVRTQEARILEVSEEVATLRALVQSLQQQLDDGRKHREAIAAGLVRYDGAGAWRRLFGRIFSLMTDVQVQQ